ncbi:MAG TPA: VOC family protein [Candidatus Acidoferrum sp.]|nr:VOC family protein [Candidatus Acidoferrum sp.]
MKFDHFGVVVKNLARDRQRLTDTLGIQKWTDEVSDPVNGVRVQFGCDGSGVNYELIEPFGDRSPVAQALKMRRNILNHVAYLVEDLQTAGEKLLSAGYAAVETAKPAVAYQGRLIQFFVTPQNFIIELIEAPDHKHLFRSAGR